MARVVTIPYRPREQFSGYHGRTQRWACLVAHRRAGKTVACINDVIARAVKEGKNDGRYAYIAPFYSQAKSVAWDYLLRYSEPIQRAKNASELWVELLGGQRVRLFGADNADALRGNYWDGVVCDEYGDWRPSVYGSVIRPALADRNGWCTFIGTPKGHNGFYDVYKQAANDPAWFSQVLRASETGLLSQEELVDSARSMSRDQYEQEFECSFEAAIQGAYYGRELAQAEREGRICSVAYDPELPVYTAWDLGYRDDTAIWWYQVVRDEVHVIDFHASSGQTVAFYGDLIRSKRYEYALHWLPHDARAKTLASGGKSIVEQLAEFLSIGSMRIVPNLDVQDGIQAARMMLPKTYFDAERCDDGLEALKQYQREYDEDKKAFRERPRHDWTSHPADAFRMLAVAWREAEKPEDKPAPVRSLVVGQNTVTLDDLWNEHVRTSRRVA